MLLELDADTLVLCGHHYDVHWLVLHVQGWEVVRDLRSQLN